MQSSICWVDFHPPFDSIWCAMQFRFHFISFRFIRNLYFIVVRLARFASFFFSSRSIFVDASCNNHFLFCGNVLSDHHFVVCNHMVLFAIFISVMAYCLTGKLDAIFVLSLARCTSCRCSLLPLINNIMEWWRWTLMESALYIYVYRCNVACEKFRF